MVPPGTLVNAIRSALAFVILSECFASFLSLATDDEMPKADKATIEITDRRKSLGFMIQVQLIRDIVLAGHGANRKSSARVLTGGAKTQKFYSGTPMELASWSFSGRSKTKRLQYASEPQLLRTESKPQIKLSLS